MSLINDALKQAKAAQPVNVAPAEGPALKPVEREQRPRGPGLLLPALIVVILIMAVVLLWQWFAHSGKADLTVRARTMPEVAPAVAAVPAAAAKVVEPVAKTVVAPTAAPVTTNVVASSVEPTNALIAAEPVKPEPPVYKLQSIFFTSKNPTAFISGKMVSVGEKVKGAQVISIKQESVTIVTPTGETLVMELN